MLLALVYSLIAFVNSFIPQQTLSEGLVGQPKSLNVLDLVTNQADLDVAKLVHRGLMKYDSKGNLVTDLAENYKISDDKKEYTFNLHKDIFWHDGKKFVSDDVIYTVSKLNLQSVAVDKLDDHTVRFRLAQDPYVPFLDLMTRYLLPSNYRVEEKSGLNPVGIGDFRVARIIKSSKVDSIILTLAWPWMKNKYKFSKVVFKFYSNEQELQTGVKLGEVSTFGSVNNLETFNNFNKISVAVGARTYTLYFNLTKEPLKDKTLRQYLSSLTPKAEIIENVLKGMAVSSNGPLEYTFVNPNEKPDYLKRRPFKPQIDPELKIVITVPKTEGEGEDFYLKIAEILKNSWESGGVRVEIKQVPLGKIFTEIIAKKDFEILLFGQEVNRDPDVYSLWHSTQKDLPGLNFTSFSNVLSDRSLEEARREFNKDLRIKAYLNFIKVFNEEVPAIFLYHPLYNYYFKKDLAGPNLEGLFFTSDRFNNLENWQKK